MEQQARTEQKQLRIAMIGHKRIPSREGGVEIVVGELAARMAALGHDVTAYSRRGHHVSGRAYDPREPEKAAEKYRGVRIRPVPTLPVRGLAALTSSFFASVMAAAGGYDCIHYHAEGPCAMLWIPRLFGIRTVATIHGLDWRRAKWGGLAARYIRAGEKIAAKYADAVIVLSQSARRYFWDTYRRDTVFIPNGISRPASRPAAAIAARWGLSTGGYILFLGRIVPEKGLDYLIEAFRQTKTDKKLVIAGGASDSDAYCRSLTARAGDDVRIFFTGFVQGELLAELYSNAYLYVLPSDLEGMPLSLLEAMSYGNCCLVSDIPECTEVAEDHAAVFRKGDVRDLRDRLQFLLDHPQTVKRYQAAAADFICRKYDWNTVVERTLAVYRGEYHEDSAGQ